MSGGGPRQGKGGARSERPLVFVRRREIFGACAADDPSATLAWERARRERDEMYRPRLLIDVSLQAEQQREREQARAHLREAARREAKERAERERERYLRAAASRQLPTEAEPIDSEDSASPASPPPVTPPATPPATPPRKHKHHHHRHDHRDHHHGRAHDDAADDDLDRTDTPLVSSVALRSLETLVIHNCKCDCDWTNFTFLSPSRVVLHRGKKCYPIPARFSQSA